MTWLDACREEIQRWGLDPEVGEVLRAFGGEHAPGPAALDAPLPTQALSGEISHTLAAEVDEPQAAMFARRFESVSGLLLARASEDPIPRLLRVALYRRAAQILAEEPPRALRIRALIDYVWSQAIVLQGRRREAPSLEALAQGLELREFAPGLSHGRIEGLSQAGPLHVNVLRARSPRLLALDARPQTDLVALAKEHGALAAISGGFFLYSEPDIRPPSQRTDPVGLLISAGEVKGPPVFSRAALVQAESGALSIQRLGMRGVSIEAEGQSWVAGVDANIVHRGQAEVARPGPGQRGIACCGARVVEVGRGPVAVPLAGFVLLAAEGPPLEVGAEVRYRLPGPPLAAAMAGGPLLLGPNSLDLALEEFAGSAPPLTFSQDETFDRNLLPRMGVGLTGEGELVALAVDGRNLERAPGLTLRSTGRLLAALGCEVALNLDGGSSKRMVVQGRVVDLPTTEVVSSASEPEGARAVRPVHSAILFLPRSAS